MFNYIKTIKLTIFCYIVFSTFPSISQTIETVPLNNMVQHKNPKQISPIIFEDFYGNQVNLEDYSGKLIIINFWATWCKPCKEEMPSLDSLNQDKTFKNLIIFPVNMEKPNTEKTERFFSDLNIKKLKIFFDSKLNFVKELNLRGVPTTVLINKKSEEFARITGSIDFKDEIFLKWLSKYD